MSKKSAPLPTTTDAHQPIFVDQVRGDQRTREARAAMGEDILSLLRLSRAISVARSPRIISVLPQRASVSDSENTLLEFGSSARVGLGRARQCAAMSPQVLLP